MRVLATRAWHTMRDAHRGVQAEVAHRIAVAEVLPAQDAHSAELPVLDPERVVVLIAVGALVDEPLDVRGARARAHVERELVAGHEPDQRGAIRTGRVQTRQRDAHAESTSDRK